MHPLCIYVLQYSVSLEIGGRSPLIIQDDVADIGKEENSKEFYIGHFDEQKVYENVQIHWKKIAGNSTGTYSTFGVCLQICTSWNYFCAYDITPRLLKPLVFELKILDLFFPLYQKKSEHHLLPCPKTSFASGLSERDKPTLMLVAHLMDQHGSTSKDSHEKDCKYEPVLEHSVYMLLSPHGL